MHLKYFNDLCPVSYISSNRFIFKSLLIALPSLGAALALTDLFLKSPSYHCCHCFYVLGSPLLFNTSHPGLLGRHTHFPLSSELLPQFESLLSLCLLEALSLPTPRTLTEFCFHRPELTICPKKPDVFFSILLLFLIFLRGTH